MPTKEWWNYTLLFLLLAISGNPFFIELHGVQDYYIILVLTTIVALYRREHRVVSLFISYSIPILLLNLYQLLSFDDAKLSTILFFMMKIYIGIGLLVLIGDDFVKKYFNIMVAVAVISLGGFLYNIFIGVFPGIVISEGNYNSIRYTSVLYTQMYGEFFINRNAGMFWEPGAFQGFLNIALFFSFYLQNHKYLFLKRLILVIAVITTFSTTGYISMAFLFLLFLLKTKSLKTGWKIFGMLFLIIIFTFAYTTIDFLEAKIASNVESDEGGRIAGYVMAIDKLGSDLFMGRSYVTEFVYDGGNGFLFHLISLGLVGLAYYYLILFIRYNKSTNRSFFIPFIMLLILIYQGEGFIIHPLFLGIAFIQYPKDFKQKLLIKYSR